MLITFEGPDGSGKSTQIGLLSEFLREADCDVLVTREPGGTTIGERIRTILHDVKNTGMSSEAEILLYSASRAQLVAELIRPNLAAGKTILCDRFYDSTIAYQGYGRGLDLDMLHRITTFAVNHLKPDLTLLLDLDVEAGLLRRERGDVEINRMDLQGRAFYQRVRAGYHELAAADPDRWVIVDANRPIEAIQADLRAIVADRMRIRSTASSG
jgi:dTMP kinase